MMESFDMSSVNIADFAATKLTPGNIALATGLLLLLQWSYQVLHYHYFHPLSKFPGPFWGGVTRLWIAYHDWTGDEPTTCEKLVQKYGRSWSISVHRRLDRPGVFVLNFLSYLGPIFRITPTMLFVSSSSAIPTIYRRDANKAKTYITGSFGEPENIFNVQNYKQHAGMRKLMARPVSKPLP